MQVIFDLTTIKTPTAIALGNFDGIHRGHNLVIAAALDKSLLHAHSTLVTFHPHPRQFFSGAAHSLLTPLPEKIAYLESLGLEQVVLLPFNQKLAALTPSEFVAEILVKQLQASQVSVGSNFHFGCDRSGNAQDLERLANHHGIYTKIIPLQNLPIPPDLEPNLLPSLPSHEYPRISSSSIRHHLTLGHIRTANLLLGRAYTLQGNVIKGKQIGRTIGFSTANLDIPLDKFLPRYGVYAVIVVLENQRLRGVMNVGVRPSVAEQYRPTIKPDGNEEKLPTVEVHLLDWQGDLYGKTLIVELIEFLRPEQKFSSLDALKAQIAKDAEAARLIKNSPHPPAPSSAGEGE